MVIEVTLEREHLKNTGLAKKKTLIVKKTPARHVESIRETRSSHDRIMRHLK
jgi:hypothetical protein